MSSSRAPWWRHRQRERFARAADAMPDQAHDPKLAGELAVVVMLRRSAAATAPEQAARDRMRASVLERLAAQPTEPIVVTPPTVPRGRVTGTRGRVAIALGAAFCLVLALSGMTLLLSRNALPGDPLYAVRRTVESASLGLTSGDDGKGRKHLTYAADRIGDIQSLAARYPDLADSPIGDYLTAFADFDADARAGTIDLTDYATSHGDNALTTLRDWAGQQAGRITQVEPRLPQVARTRAGRSVDLLGRITRRTEALAARNDCFTITSGAADDLGVLPATGPCDTAPGTAGAPVPATSAAGREPSVTTGSGAGVDGRRAPVPTPDTTTFTTPPVAGVPPVVDTPVPTTADQPPNTITLPLPLPGLTVPPLLPGLPGLRVGQ